MVSSSNKKSPARGLIFYKFRYWHPQLNPVIKTTSPPVINYVVKNPLSQMGLGLGERYYTPQEIRTESGMEPEPEDGFEDLPPPEQQPEDGIEQQ